MQISFGDKHPLIIVWVHRCHLPKASSLWPRKSDMVTATVIPIQGIRLGFLPIVHLNRRSIQFSIAATAAAASKLRCSCYFLGQRELFLLHRARASSEEPPNDPKFVPLTVDDPVFGPPALLLMGFDVAETNEIQEFLKDIDGEFLKIIHCTEDMLAQPIWDAVHCEQPNLKDVKVARSLPRICFLSGLNGEEMLMLIDAFPKIGLRPAVFAALVPNSANKLLKDVAEEIMCDHEMLSASRTT